VHPKRKEIAPPRRANLLTAGNAFWLAFDLAHARYAGGKVGLMLAPTTGSPPQRGKEEWAPLHGEEAWA